MHDGPDDDDASERRLAAVHARLVQRRVVVPLDEKGDDQSAWRDCDRSGSMPRGAHVGRRRPRASL